jgi:hypothetical protein
MRTNDQECWITQLIGAACCVVGSNPEVKSITVVTNRQPHYNQLAQIRTHATACGANFTAAERGTVVIRRSSRLKGSSNEPF